MANPATHRLGGRCSHIQRSIPLVVVEEESAVATMVQGDCRITPKKRARAEDLQNMFLCSLWMLRPARQKEESGERYNNGGRDRFLAKWVGEYGFRQIHFLH